MGEEELRGLLVRENELRLSDETQRAYEAAEAGGETDWIEVTEALQRRVGVGVLVVDEQHQMRDGVAARGVHREGPARGHLDEDPHDVPALEPEIQPGWRAPAAPASLPEPRAITLSAAHRASSTAASGRFWLEEVS